MQWRRSLSPSNSRLIVRSSSTFEKFKAIKLCSRENSSLLPIRPISECTFRSHRTSSSKFESFQFFPDCKCWRDTFIPIKLWREVSFATLFSSVKAPRRPLLRLWLWSTSAVRYAEKRHPSSLKWIVLSCSISEKRDAIKHYSLGNSLLLNINSNYLCTHYWGILLTFEYWSRHIFRIKLNTTNSDFFFHLGSEAAAATAVSMIRCTSYIPPQSPIEFKVDRPFLFSIRESQRNIVLFSGKMVAPPAAK